MNYHHLLYFWLVAREGGLGPAAKLLRLTHPTLSAQIRALEESLGEPLFSREGRRLALTETGRVVYRYAGEIFSLGDEMLEVVRGRSEGRPVRFEVGVVDLVPKMIVRRLLQPALDLPEPVNIRCREDTYSRLLADLAVHDLDLVIADSPLPDGTGIRAFNHQLGECGVSFFGTDGLIARHRRAFPRSLDGAPMLLPLEGSTLRRGLDQWFDSLEIRPRGVAEFADSALLQAFGADGVGIFAGPSAVEREICRQYQVRVLGRTDRVIERFYAISMERKLRNPAVVAISNAARRTLFERRSTVRPPRRGD